MAVFLPTARLLLCYLIGCCCVRYALMLGDSRSDPVSGPGANGLAWTILSRWRGGNAIEKWHSELSYKLFIQSSRYPLVSPQIQINEEHFPRNSIDERYSFHQVTSGCPRTRPPDSFSNTI